MADCEEATLSTSRSTRSAVAVERAREQLRLVLDGDLVGAARRGQHRHHDADDGDGNDHADRDHDAQTRAVPTGVSPFFPSVLSRGCLQACAP